MAMTLEQQQLNVRALLIENLRQDVLGPSSENEVLKQNVETKEGDSPLTRYLMGILYPLEAYMEQEEDDSAEKSADEEEDSAPEASIPITSIPKPTSIGISCAIMAEADTINVEFRYGVYERPEAGTSASEGQKVNTWIRKQISELVLVSLKKSEKRNNDLPTGAAGEWLCRHDEHGYTTLTVFLRNKNKKDGRRYEPEQCLYQPEIRIFHASPESAPIVNRQLSDIRNIHDAEAASYKLLYRDKPEYAVGHGCAVEWDDKGAPPNRARLVRTEILPVYEVSSTESKGGIGLTGLKLEHLVNTANGNEVKRMLQPLADQYDAWIERQEKGVQGLGPEFHDVAYRHLDECKKALARIRTGLELISMDSFVFDAFKFANEAMLLQRQKSVEAANLQRGKGRIFDASLPEWRPFQIAFILLNLQGIADGASEDRDIVDLLWFPTGGGKTEAYLGLAAFTIALRRLRHMKNPQQQVCGDGGVTVLMRYTLRLLTIQQFQRAATLICACEVLRRHNGKSFGSELISIGLWVGGAATPNYIDQADKRYGLGAYQILESFDEANEPSEGNPVQLRSCPWCGEPLSYKDYTVIKELKHLQIRCPNKECDFHGSDADYFSGIPAYLVDEDIYLRCPTLVIGTVDKFARLPWDESTKALFGRVDRRCERHGFIVEGEQHESGHRSTDRLPRTGPPREIKPFLPPDLIIQDELHLISGPLGSLMGLYESAIDFLCAQSGRRPKVIASTATIRGYLSQIENLFDRKASQFPPPGLIAGDSFFAAENKSKPGRIYVGICPVGRSLKHASALAMASLLDSASIAKDGYGLDVVDPYWTLVHYFNSLRELGSNLRLLVDTVPYRMKYLARRRDSLLKRALKEDPKELTSRIPSREIPKLLKRMEETLASGNALDVLLCSNMISVGVDVQRFGLMLVAVDFSYVAIDGEL